MGQAEIEGPHPAWSMRCFSGRGPSGDARSNLRKMIEIVPASLLAMRSRDPSPPDGANFFSNPDAQPRPLVR